MINIFFLSKTELGLLTKIIVLPIRTIAVCYSYRINVVVFSTACGGSFNGPNGNVSSPNYPNNYPSNSNCTYTIEVEPGHVVFISFSDLQLEGDYGDNNCWDFIEVSTKREQLDLLYQTLRTFVALNPSETVKREVTPQRCTYFTTKLI